jgi:hypothetical protein
LGSVFKQEHPSSLVQRKSASCTTYGIGLGFKAELQLLQNITDSVRAINCRTNFEPYGTFLRTRKNSSLSIVNNNITYMTTFDFTQFK